MFNAIYYVPLVRAFSKLAKTRPNGRLLKAAGNQVRMVLCRLAGLYRSFLCLLRSLEESV